MNLGELFTSLDNNIDNNILANNSTLLIAVLVMIVIFGFRWNTLTSYNLSQPSVLDGVAEYKISEPHRKRKHKHRHRKEDEYDDIFTNKAVIQDTSEIGPNILNPTEVIYS